MGKENRVYVGARWWVGVGRVVNVRQKDSVGGIQRLGGWIHSEGGS